MRSALTVLGLLLAAACAHAQGAPAPELVKFQDAQKLFTSGQLLEAVPLYLDLTRNEKAQNRDVCYDRLVTIYMRLGRCDQAIQTGDRYIAFLKQAGDVRASKLVEVQMAACWWALGHFGVAEKMLVKSIETQDKELPLSSQVAAYEMLAMCQAKRHDKTSARKSWNKIESIVSDRLKQTDEPIDDKERVQLGRKMAESLRGQERYVQAETTLHSLFAVHDRMKDDAGRRETWKELAALFRERQDLDQAEKSLDEALKLQEKLGGAIDITLADLEAERAEVLQLAKRGKDAKVWRDKAAEHYLEILKKPESVIAQGASPVLIFWKLQNLVQGAQQFRKALELTRTHSEQWSGSLLASKLDVEVGSLQFILGANKAGRQKLRDAVESLERQSPWNLIELPRAYINLAAVESTGEDLDRAEKLVDKTLDLYKEFNLTDDAVLVEACNLRGTILAQRGDYAKAIQHFREGLKRCSAPTVESPMQRTNLLLNIALLHKSQGELPEAVAICTQALAEFERIAEPDSLGFAAFDAGLANMLLAQNKIPEAFERTQRLTRLCEIHKVDRGPLVVTARHVRAIHFLSQRELTQAEANWHELMRLQEREDQTALLPRTINYLGLAAELRATSLRPKDPSGANKAQAEAEELYLRALRMQESNQRSFPATHFITLWRLANVVKDTRKEQALDYINRSIKLVEKARLRMFGDAQQRATFFAQFGPAFEQNVDWLLKDGSVEQAFQVLTRGRSRTLMDQLQLANLDPVASLTGPAGDDLRRREHGVRSRLAALRARAGLIGAEDMTPEQIKKLITDFDAAQEEYAEIWREIWNMSPEYHALADPTLPEQVLPKLRQRVLGPKTVLLVYHIGKQSSQVILLGDKSVASVYYPLEAPEELSQYIAPPEARTPEGTLAELRGVVLVPKEGVKPTPTPPVVALPDPPPPGKMAPLTQTVARSLIERYRQEILDREYQTTRGFVIKSRDPKRPLATQRPDLVGQVFLPKKLRDRLAELKPETIIVVPDGPLHTLPLESLVLEAGPRPKFVIDELPPLTYAPSGAILAALADRPRVKNSAEPTLLSVCNPSYPEAKTVDVAFTGGREGSFVGFAGQLPRLPYTEQESKLVRRFFPKERTTVVSEVAATERGLTQAVKGKTIVHVAAHGFADSRFGNLFGALALAPSLALQPASDDDGFLSLYEIYRLPLEECDLAVLSACLTHIGPQQPMEAGVTLANGFLSAGARRVVASHWNVADRSTAQLMSTFFEAMSREENGKRLSTAQAMQEARRRLRNSTDANWSSPFYWAPFVVLGAPAE